MFHNSVGKSWKLFSMILSVIFINERANIQPGIETFYYQLTKFKPIQKLFTIELADFWLVVHNKLDCDWLGGGLIDDYEQSPIPSVVLVISLSPKS